MLLKKWFFILCVLSLGTFIMAKDKVAMDDYYNDLDSETPVLAAHKKIDDASKGLFRKRAYKRKRIKRPPRRGK